MAEISPELIAVIKEISAANNTALLEAIKELKKPSEAEQRKLDEEKQKLEERTRARVQNAIAEEQARLNTRKGCPHGRETAAGAFKHAWGAQPNQDGYFRPMCQICHTVMPKVKCTEEMLRSGINLHTYRISDISALEMWHKASVKECDDPNCYIHKVPVAV